LNANSSWGSALAAIEEEENVGMEGGGYTPQLPKAIAADKLEQQKQANQELKDAVVANNEDDLRAAVLRLWNPSQQSDFRESRETQAVLPIR